MKKSLKTAAVISVLAAFALASGGCEKKEGAASASGSPVIQWWLTGDPPTNMSALQQAVNDYIEPKINVRVEFRWFSWADQTTRTTTMINSGEYWDIWSLLGANYYDWARRGVFASIDPADYPGLGIIPQALWEGFTVNGKVYAVPTYKDSAAAHYVMWNSALVDKYGIQLKDGMTLADYDRAFRAIKAGEGAKFYPVHDAKGEPAQRFLYVTDYDLSPGITMGVKFGDASAKIVNLLEAQDYRDALNVLHKWYQDGIINPDAPQLDQAPTNAAVGLGQGWPLAWNDQWASNAGWAHAYSNLAWGPIYTTDTILAYNGVSSNSKYKTECFKFLELVNSDHKLRDMLKWGVEGTDFQYVTENTIKRISDNTQLPDFELGTFFIESIEDGEPNYLAEIKALNEAARVSPIFGFVFDRTPVQNEWANCSPVWDRYKAGLFSGADDPATTIPKCLSELKANGYEKILAEAQKQIDAWLKTR